MTIAQAEELREKYPEIQSVMIGRGLIADPGMLSGGPCSGLADACARERLQGQPAGKCFVDEHGSYSTNEICVYWNSPMVALLAGILEG